MAFKNAQVEIKKIKSQSAYTQNSDVAFRTNVLT
jgi:hypothetical protein